MVIPTLAADDALRSCLDSLSRQTFRDFDIVVLDNSGRNLVEPREGVRVIANASNAGFGAAVNQGIRASEAEFVATLNDDTSAAPQWLGSLVSAMERHPEAGMCASRVVLDERLLDSAGMLVCRDGSSKQRGHGAHAERHMQEEEVLLPSGSASLWRRSMLDTAGWFDEEFFLYCEDTDLGLRARWAGWKCWYVPEAKVEHRYSHSAGRASPLKAYYVERNRLFVLIKNFPWRMLFAAPFVSAVRYFWHVRAALDGRGAAGAFQRQGERTWKLAWFVVRAHAATLARLPRLWRARTQIRRRARITAGEFESLLERHSISPREVAYL